MGMTKRAPKIQEKAYIEIDLQALRETGEIVLIGKPIIAPTITTAVPRGQFEVTYTAELFNIMQKLGNRKIEVLAYLLDHKDATNSINTSQRAIATELGISKQTVNATINILQDAGLIKRKGSVYMVSPSLMVKGNQIREAWLMRRYEEIPERIHVDYDVELDGQQMITMDGDIAEVTTIKRNK